MFKLAPLFMCLLCLSHKPAVLHVNGEIDPDQAKLVVDYLDKNKGPVELVLNGPGGDVFSASIIENAIEEHQSVTCVVRGFALSADASILESCAIREMTGDSVLMIHSVAITTGGGNTVQADDQKAAIDALNKALAVHLARHSKMTLEQILARLNTGREWWIDAPTALELGLIDRIVP